MGRKLDIAKGLVAETLFGRKPKENNFQPVAGKPRYVKPPFKDQKSYNAWRVSNSKKPNY